MPELRPEHFRLLRLAILRGLSIDQTGPDVFLVGSHSHPTHRHTVNPVEQSCCCPAFGWCAHLSIALDRWYEREGGLTERGDYFEARRMDFGSLPTRPDAHRDDRRYLAACVGKAREKYAALLLPAEREVISF